MLNLLAQATQPIHGTTPWLPPQASSLANNVDWIQHFITWITLFFTVLIFSLMIYFVVRYRHKKGGKPQPSAAHSTTLELTWTIIPTILVVIIFFYGFREYVNMIVIPPNTYEIRAHGYMWGWSFTYPNGFVDNELHVPEGVPVRIVLTSEDVIHALYIPALRLQKSNVPGRYNKMWFKGQWNHPELADQPTKDSKPYTEEYDIYCNQYCGTKHSEMISKIVFHRAADYPAFLEDRSIWVGKVLPVDQGQKIYTKNGCVQCHSLDGTKNTGPSWKDLWGRSATFTDGTAYKADDAYIRESILRPDAHIVNGYSNAMPSYAGQLKDDDIEAVIRFMKSISTHWDGGDPNAGFKPAGKSGAAAATTSPATGATTAPASGAPAK